LFCVLKNLTALKSNSNTVWFNFQTYIYIYIYTTSEKPVNDQSYGVLDRYGITILYKENNYKGLKWFVKQHQVHKTKWSMYGTWTVNNFFLKFEKSL
jgi:hypothetical protein